MITAILRSEAGPRALVRSLSPLVGGVVEGVLTRVLVVAREDDGDSARIADEAGAGIILAPDWPEGLRLALKQQESPWTLALDSGVVLSEAFWPELAERLAAGDIGPFATRPQDESLAQSLRRRLSACSSPDQALVGPRESFAGDPWRSWSGDRPRLLRAASFRPAPGQR